MPRACCWLPIFQRTLLICLRFGFQKRRLQLKGNRKGFPTLGRLIYSDLTRFRIRCRFPRTFLVSRDGHAMLTCVVKKNLTPFLCLQGIRGTRVSIHEKHKNKIAFEATRRRANLPHKQAQKRFTLFVRASLRNTMETPAIRGRKFSHRKKSTRISILEEAGAHT